MKIALGRRHRSIWAIVSKNYAHGAVGVIDGAQ